MDGKSEIYFNRELSWLAFNHRVLQEAQDESVPLLERLRFLAIYSSNLDEFFRVRVASLKSLAKLKKKTRKELDMRPKKLLNEILQEVQRQQEEFGKIFNKTLLPALKQYHVLIPDEKNFPGELKNEVKKYFHQNIKPYIKPTYIKKNEFPFLENRRLYFLTSYRGHNSRHVKRHAIIEIPSEKLSRFHLFKLKKKYYVFFIDDIIRLGLKQILKNKHIEGCWAISVSRDAELYIDDEVPGDLMTKIKKNLSKRKIGLPTRFLYDSQMPTEIVSMIAARMNINEDEIIPGGKYHNFSDFQSFPNPDGVLPEHKPMPPLPQADLKRSGSIFDFLKTREALLVLPYQQFDHVLRFIEDAADDELVKDIKISLYRVAENSKVVKALLKALKNGKSVTAFVEIKARFNEASNIQWAVELKNAGANVFYSIPRLKVHSKICHITRRENGKNSMYSYLSSGNFNEETAKVFSDIGFFTADKQITKDITKLFQKLSGDASKKKFEKLLISPNDLRDALYNLIDFEIAHAKQGKKSSMMLKVNSLEDTGMINKLYEASQAGVKINLIVRGLCCLVPGVKGLSENISTISIVGRFLEHCRIYVFWHNGENKVFISSADLMTRNLSHRIEVAFPVLNDEIKKQVLTFLSLQWRDNLKARIIDAQQKNHYRKTHEHNGEKIDSQIAIYKYLTGERKDQKIIL